MTQRQSSAPKYFYVDDGSGLLDGTKTGAIDNVGLRVMADPIAYAAGDFLVITGVSSSFKVGDQLRPRVLPVAGGIEAL